MIFMLKIIKCKMNMEMKFNSKTTLRSPMQSPMRSSMRSRMQSPRQIHYSRFKEDEDDQHFVIKTNNAIGIIPIEGSLEMKFRDKVATLSFNQWLNIRESISNGQDCIKVMNDVVSNTFEYLYDFEQEFIRDSCNNFTMDNITGIVEDDKKPPRIFLKRKLNTLKNTLEDTLEDTLDKELKIGLLFSK